MADARKNFAVSAVATAPAPANSGTSLVVTAGHGARFPTAPFNLVVCPAGEAPTPANAEIVRVTTVSTDTLTITRAQESSSARSITVGDVVFAGVTVKSLDDLEPAIASGTTGQYWRGDKSWQTLNATAVGLGNVTNDAQTKAAIVPNTAPTAGQLLVGNAGGTAYAAASASGDVTVASTGAVTIANDAVSNAKLANMAASAIKARKTGSTGDPEDCTLSEVLDLVGSAAQGDILYRGASTWTRLAAGTADYYLQTKGSGQNPVWAAVSAGSGTKTYSVFTPLDNQPTASNYATLDTRNAVAVLDFDDGATNEESVFVGVIPEAASLGSGLKVRIFWAATSATSGNCRWGVQFEKYGTDIDSDSFDTATEAHTAASGTSGIVVVTEITATSIDSLAAGDQYRIKVYRDSSDTTNDTMTGDAELVAVEVRSAA